jgi:hypothetical protein
MYKELHGQHERYQTEYLPIKNLTSIDFQERRAVDILEAAHAGSPNIASAVYDV